MSGDIKKETLERWMRTVIEECRRGIANGQSPFAAAIYGDDGTQLSLTHNVVRHTSRPSQHGEVTAIDAACRSLGQSKLPSDVWLVSTGEPCPMCSATAAVAGIHNIAFGASKEMIVSAGFQTLGFGCKAFFQAADVPANIIGGIEADQCRRLLIAKK